MADPTQPILKMVTPPTVLLDFLCTDHGGVTLEERCALGAFVESRPSGVVTVSRLADYLSDWRFFWPSTAPRGFYVVDGEATTTTPPRGRLRLVGKRGRPRKARKVVAHG
jgi:hypothetical protein